MEDKELCREVLECLLQQPVGELTEVQTQREFRYTSDGKPIRLDVYNEDSDGRIYDAEMENLNHKSVESHQLPRRSRFYQGAIDIDFMDKNYSYKLLPESRVIFICTFDTFKLGWSRYTFRERCDENPEICLDDGTEKVFYNCKYEGEDIPDGIRNLYEFIGTGHTCDELTEKLDSAVTKARSNEIWRTQYMKEWVVIQDARDEGYEDGLEIGLATGREEGIKEGRKEGIKEGHEEADHETISRMLRSGKTAKEIADFCGYPIEQVKTVEKEMLVSAD
jgi:predicted transposase/invertase (TIGR01784 family)